MIGKKVPGLGKAKQLITFGQMRPRKAIWEDNNTCGTSKSAVNLEGKAGVRLGCN